MAASADVEKQHLCVCMVTALVRVVTYVNQAQPCLWMVEGWGSFVQVWWWRPAVSLFFPDCVHSAHSADWTWCGGCVLGCLCVTAVAATRCCFQTFLVCLVWCAVAGSIGAASFVAACFLLVVPAVVVCTVVSAASAAAATGSVSSAVVSVLVTFLSQNACKLGNVSALLTKSWPVNFKLSAVDGKNGWLVYDALHLFFSHNWTEFHLRPLVQTVYYPSHQLFNCFALNFASKETFLRLLSCEATSFN